ncbi:MAG: DNA double-strand break repair nuclease NurA [Desulfurococcales archaeon]|nr:DNA double-strand break repair nuclease NurA [Desulfurococcales archaeon]
MAVYPSDFYGKISVKRGLIEKLAYMQLLESTSLDHYRKPVCGPVRPLQQAATDGGLGVKRLAAFTVYMVRGYSVAYKPSDTGENMPLGEEIYADLGVLIPPSREETRISIYRDIAEIWSAVKILDVMDNSGVYLGDGSIVSLIVEPVVYRMLRSTERHPIKCINERIDLNVLELESIKEPLASRRLLGVDEASAVRGSGNLLLRGDRELGDCALYLEFIEKTVLLRRLLVKAWEKNIIPIFISKSSRTSFLYNHDLYTDVFLIQLADPMEPGYFYNPERVSVSGDIEGHLWRLLEKGTISSLDLFPENVLGLADFYSRLNVLRFYVRLAFDAPVLRVEVPFSSGELEGMSKEELSKNMETIISSVSRELVGLELTDGYPMILKIVHERSKITANEAAILFGSLGLQARHGSREVLGE